MTVPLALSRINQRAQRARRERRLHPLVVLPLVLVLANIVGELEYVKRSGVQGRRQERVRVSESESDCGMSDEMWGLLECVSSAPHSLTSEVAPPALLSTLESRAPAPPSSSDFDFVCLVADR
eukprot:scaffold237264_cov30-Tisochrysis_lutea.AAC.1